LKYLRLWKNIECMYVSNSWLARVIILHSLCTHCTSLVRWQMSNDDNTITNNCVAFWLVVFTMMWFFNWGKQGLHGVSNLQCLTLFSHLFVKNYAQKSGNTINHLITSRKNKWCLEHSLMVDNWNQHLQLPKRNHNMDIITVTHRCVFWDMINNPVTWLTIWIASMITLLQRQCIYGCCSWLYKQRWPHLFC
jgi:hypothetical protein